MLCLELTRDSQLVPDCKCMLYSSHLLNLSSSMNNIEPGPTSDFDRYFELPGESAAAWQTLFDRDGDSAKGMVYKELQDAILTGDPQRLLIKAGAIVYDQNRRVCIRARKDLMVEVKSIDYGHFTAQALGCNLTIGTKHLPELDSGAATRFEIAHLLGQ